MPSSTDGIPSRMNIHCQFLRPKPSSWSRKPESGAAMKLAIGMAVMNPAVTRPR